VDETDFKRLLDQQLVMYQAKLTMYVVSVISKDAKKAAELRCDIHDIMDMVLDKILEELSDEETGKGR